MPTKLFTMRMKTYEKAMLAELAKELRRPQSEVIRLLIRETLRALKSQPADISGHSSSGKTQQT